MIHNQSKTKIMIKCLQKINDNLLTYHLIGKGLIGYYSKVSKNLRVISTNGQCVFQTYIDLDENEFVDFCEDTYSSMIEDNTSFEAICILLN